MGLCATITMNDIKHNVFSVTMLSVIMLNVAIT
jgi:hypothetical protein